MTVSLEPSNEASCLTGCRSWRQDERGVSGSVFTSSLMAAAICPGVGVVEGESSETISRHRERRFDPRTDNSSILTPDFLLFYDAPTFLSFS